MQLIPDKAIMSFEKLEKNLDPKYSARDIAKAYSSIPPSQCLQVLAFTPFPKKEILKEIYYLKLDKAFNIKPGTSLSENKEFWVRSLVALGSYLYTPETKKIENIPYNIAMGSFHLVYNGVDMFKARKLLQKQKCNNLRSLAFSLGGDIWKNSLLNRKNGNTKQEYIFDTLGLRITELYIDNPKLKLTELMQEANNLDNVEFAINYKDSSYWKIAQQCFVPNKDNPLNRFFAILTWPFKCNCEGSLDYSNID